MLIKSADDKSKRLALLEDLQNSSLLDARQKDWLCDELRNLNAGIKGKRAAAFYLDGHYKDGQNNVLLRYTGIESYERLRHYGLYDTVIAKD